MLEQVLEISDLNDQYRVKQQGWRLVLNPRRAKKLRNRGEYVRWSQFYNGWIWKYVLLDVNKNVLRKGDYVQVVDYKAFGETSHAQIVGIERHTFADNETQTVAVLKYPNGHIGRFRYESISLRKLGVEELI